MRYWIKLYTEIVRDPKMGRLTDRQFRTCINLFALAGTVDEDGKLPPVEDMAWHLRMDDADLTADLEVLARVNIVEQTDGAWIVRKWAERQAKAPSDEPERVAQRVRNYRERKRNENVTPLPKNVTRLETETETDVDTETEKKRKETETDTLWSSAVKLYENNIGLLSSAIAEDMQSMWSELEAAGVPGWWEQAVTVAVAANKRSWSYMRGILQRCLREGHPPIASTNGKGPPRPKKKVTITLPDGQLAEVDV
jgi:DnaD/phage-associated family protein